MFLELTVTSGVLQGVIFLPGNRVTEHPINGDEPGKFLFEVVPGRMKLQCADSAGVVKGGRGGALTGGMLICQIK